MPTTTAGHCCGRFISISRRLDVVETLDQWYGPDYRYVKVRTSDGDTYILKFHETHADWELTMFSRAYTRVRMI